jgi:ribonucleoside-diphosphate reductase beta chain
MMENIHSETYSLLIDTYVKDEAEKDKLFKLLKTFLPSRRKLIGLLRWIDSLKLCRTINCFCSRRGHIFLRGFLFYISGSKSEASCQGSLSLTN